jgi:hypothetical protein
VVFPLLLVVVKKPRDVNPREVGVVNPEDAGQVKKLNRVGVVKLERAIKEQSIHASK